MAAGLSGQHQGDDHRRWTDEIRFGDTQETLDLIRAFDLIWRRRPASSLIADESGRDAFSSHLGE